MSEAHKKPPDATAACQPITVIHPAQVLVVDIRISVERILPIK
jgi:hypothetical protein